MRREAIRLGVPAGSIEVDTNGLNTLATVRNTKELARAAGWQRLIAVSEFYHLPRIKMTYAAEGMQVFTVPAEPRHWKRSLAVANVAREIPAFWIYLARSVLTHV